MLPILRIVSVGGVFLAITILLLALIPPGGTHLVTSQREVGARGPLMVSVQHPEWRQFRIQAAFLRADELERLRRLPDVVIRAPELEAYAAEKLDRALDEALGKAHAQPAAPVFAGLPAAAADAEPEDVTGSIGGNPDATLPIDIGATSSSELPVITHEELPPVVRLPALQLPALDVPETENLPLPAARPAGAGATALRPEPPKRAVQQRQRRRAVAPVVAAPAPVPPPFNILAAIFESLGAARTTPQVQASAQATAAQPPNRQAVATRAVSQ